MNDPDQYRREAGAASLHTAPSAGNSLRMAAIRAGESWRRRLASLRQSEDILRWTARSAPVRSLVKDPELDDIGLILGTNLFDADFYRAGLPAGFVPSDLRELVVHYLAVGSAEGRDPRPDFSRHLYLNYNPDVRASSYDPFVHFLRFGAIENRRLRYDDDAFLDEEFAVDMIAHSGLFGAGQDGRAAGGDQGEAIRDYVRRGAKTELDPHPDFETRFYQAIHEDVPPAFNPFVHFMLFGAAEGRSSRRVDAVYRLPGEERTIGFRRALRDLPFIILSALGLRVVVLGLPGRIGHLAKDFDSYIKERLIDGRRAKPIYLSLSPPANELVLEYWEKYITVVRGSLAHRLAWLERCRPIVSDLTLDYAYTLEGASPCFEIEERWGDRPPLFQLDAEHARRGEEILRRMGLPDGAWFACVHAREEGYGQQEDSGHHNYRNASIANFEAAIAEIVRRGGWCIRMGDHLMQPVVDVPGLIDYATSPFKSDLMDLFLCARCRFFLGTSSGLFLLASMFGVRSALTNMAPLGCSYSFSRGDISIPKLYRDKTGRLISFPRVMSTPAAEFRWTFLFEESGITVEENTSDDILDITLEMFDRIDGVYAPSDDGDALQETFRSLFTEANYSWRSPAAICERFLRKHRELLVDDGVPLHTVPWRGGARPNPAAGTRRRGFRAEDVRRRFETW